MTLSYTNNVNIYNKGEILMENNNQTKKQFEKNKTKIIILVSIIISISIILIVGLALLFNKNAAKVVNSKTMENIETDQNVQSINVQSEEIGNVETQQVKSEEELQKINEKEIKEAEEQARKSGKSINTKSKYFIRVNLQRQVINIYTYDNNGNYTVPVKAFVCSTGTATPNSGTYTMASSGGSKRKVWTLYGNVYGQYVTPIVGDILFHSVPYLRKNGSDVAHDSLEYWEYDKLGTRASMGCIRLTTRDAKWIYDNVSLWTKVEFYSSSSAGPFGKPSAQKISNAPGNLKNWDPTDPNKNNPWRDYKPEQENNKKEEKNEITNKNENENKNEIIDKNEIGKNIVEENTEKNELINNVIKNEVTNNTVPKNEIKNNQIENSSNAIENKEQVNIVNKNVQVEKNNYRKEGK